MSNHEDELYRAQRKAYWLKRFLNYGSTIFIFVAILGYYFYGDIITQSGLLGNFRVLVIPENGSIITPTVMA